jgi:hypothetical protein
MGTKANGTGPSLNGEDPGIERHLPYPEHADDIKLKKKHFSRKNCSSRFRNVKRLDHHQKSKNLCRRVLFS